jgi:hypothetical protein
MQQCNTSVHHCDPQSILIVVLHCILLFNYSQYTALLDIGMFLERSFGWFNVALIFLVSGVFSTAVSAIFLPTQVSNDFA